MIYLGGMFVSAVSVYAFTHSSQYTKNRTSQLKYLALNLKIYLMIIISFFPLFWISAWRSGIGTDFITYERIFNDIKEDNLKDKIETGYILLNKLCLIFTDNPQSIFILTSLLYCHFVYLSIYEQSDNIVLSTIFFVLLSNFCISMNVIRQFLASSICVYAFKYIYDKKLAKYVFFVLIASSIHFVCILFLFIYFLPRIKMNQWRCICFFITFLLGKPFYHIVLQKLFFGTKYYPLLMDYPTGGYLFTIFMCSINLLYLVLFFYKYRINKNNVKYQIFLNLHILALAVSTLLPVIPQIERALWIVSYAQFLSVPFAITQFRNARTRTFIVILIITINLLFFYLNFFIYHNHAVWPYRSIFS